MAYKRSYQPYFGLAWACLALLLAAWVWFPKAALAVTVAGALIGDIVTVYWFPFNKNLSSWESIMFLSDGLSVSPLEITTIVALGLTMYRNLVRIRRPLMSTPLLVPLATFGAFAVLGLARGLSRGGDSRAALFEIRPLLILPLLYVLITNVCTSRTDYRRVFWAAMVGIVVQSLLSLRYLSGLTPVARDALESLGEHGSSIGMNVIFVAFAIALAYRGVSNPLRFALLIASVPVMWVYLVAQRRAAVVALVVGLVLFAIMLFWRQRRTFWKVIPLVTLLFLGYVGAFWGSDSSAGFPAQAVKSVIAPGDVSEEDRSSDLYRELERLDLSATIRSSPVLGIGFGQPFLRPFPLADISVFEFQRYIPHNSFLWIWTKLGYGGMVTLLYIVGRSMMQGSQRARASPDGIDALVALSAVIFVAMYVVFLYIDIAWEPRNVVLLALSMAICTGPLEQHLPLAGSQPSTSGVPHLTSR